MELCRDPAHTPAHYYVLAAAVCCSRLVHIGVLLEAGFKRHNAIVAQQLNLAFAGETAVQLQLIACATVSTATPASMSSQQLPAVGFSGLFCVVAASRYLLFRVPRSYLPTALLMQWRMDAM
jgi:hypothetical protein